MFHINMSKKKAVSLQYFLAASYQLPADSFTRCPLSCVNPVDGGICACSLPDIGLHSSILKMPVPAHKGIPKSKVITSVL